MKTLQIPREDLKLKSKDCVFFLFCFFSFLSPFCCSQNSRLYQAGLCKCLFPIWCHGAWAHVLKDLPSLNISCKIRGPHLHWKVCAGILPTLRPSLCLEESRMWLLPPLPGILPQFCLEFLAADESCTKGSASSGSRPTLRATARKDTAPQIPS